MRAGSRLDGPHLMDAPQRTGQFGCPFCRSGSLLLIGGNRRFQYHRCDDCAEIWTVTQDWQPGDPRRPEPRPALMH